MNIKTIISQIVLQLHDNDSPGYKPEFLYGDEFEQNLQSENAHYPIIVLDTPVEYDFELFQSGTIQDNAKINILFADLAAMDATPQDHDLIIAEQKIHLKNFISALQNSDLIREVLSASGKEVTNLFDVNVSGMMLSVVIKLFDDNIIC